MCSNICFILSWLFKRWSNRLSCDQFSLTWFHLGLRLWSSLLSRVSEWQFCGLAWIWSWLTFWVHNWVSHSCSFDHVILEEVLYESSIPKVHLVQGELSFWEHTIVPTADRNDEAGLDQMWLQKVLKLYEFKVWWVNLRFIQFFTWWNIWNGILRLLIRLDFLKLIVEYQIMVSIWWINITYWGIFWRPLFGRIFLMFVWIDQSLGRFDRIRPVRRFISPRILLWACILFIHSFIR